MPDDQSTSVVLQKLSPKHKDVLALLAQGVARHEIAKVCDFTPEYVTWLARQPVCQAYLRDMQQFVDTRLLALTERSVDVMAEAMLVGSTDDKLKAAKMQLEATGRLGRERGSVPDGGSAADRLTTLAERLVSLLDNKRMGVTVNGSADEVTIESA